MRDRKVKQLASGHIASRGWKQDTAIDDTRRSHPGWILSTVYLIAALRNRVSLCFI